MFAGNAVYERQDGDQWAVYHTLGSADHEGSIAHFFARIRPLTGQHQVTSIESDPSVYLHPFNISAQHDGSPLPAGRRVLVRGRFQGHAQDMPISLTFQDMWIFDQDRKVIFRKSWIQPQANV